MGKGIEIFHVGFDKARKQITSTNFFNLDGGMTHFGIVINNAKIHLLLPYWEQVKDDILSAEKNIMSIDTERKFVGMLFDDKSECPYQLQGNIISILIGMPSFGDSGRKLEFSIYTVNAERDPSMVYDGSIYFRYVHHNGDYNWHLQSWNQNRGV